MDLDLIAEPCAVCSDKSTGTHYGTVSCNGCKGFFRRTILRNQRFVCRFNKQCVIDKNFRCACRFCRFQKCLKAGMKREAIQFERESMATSSVTKKRPTDNVDLINLRDNSAVNNVESNNVNDSYCDVINTLINMEARVNHEMAMRYRNSVNSSLSNLSNSQTSSNQQQKMLNDQFNSLNSNCGFFTTSSNPLQYQESGSTACESNSYNSGHIDGDESSSAFMQLSKPCTVEDLNEISRTTLLLMVEWAKNFAPFPDLCMEDKIILLKNYAPQHLILMPAFRSPDTTRVCLFNNTYMSRNEASGETENNGFAAFKQSNITPRVLDEIVWPMRQLQMREEEFVCLKALAFLHPEAKGLTQVSQNMIRDARNRVLKALYAIIFKQNPEDAQTRYGNILLLAPALKALTQLLIENMTLTKFFGLAEVDSLLSEFILDDLNDPHASAPASIKEHLSLPTFTTTGNASTSYGPATTSTTDLLANIKQEPFASLPTRKPINHSMVSGSSAQGNVLSLNSVGTLLSPIDPSISMFSPSVLTPLSLHQSGLTLQQKNLQKSIIPQPSVSSNNNSSPNEAMLTIL